MTSASVHTREVSELQDLAHTVRRRILRMAADKGEGYVAQGLGITDALVALYYRELRIDPAAPDDPQRDRFILSTGHYSIALYAIFVELGILTAAEADTYALNGSSLPMSTFAATPGVEITSGSLGHGLGQGVGMALGLRLDDSAAKVVVELSDGELQEGSTWEAAMAASSFELDNLWAVVDCNGIQADGKLVLNIEPVADKWRAFGWSTTEIDGNDMTAILAAFDHLRGLPGPRVIVLRTTPGFGLPTLTTALTALPEVTRGLARTVDDPFDAGEWASTILEMLRTPDRHAPSPEDVRALRAFYHPSRIAAQYASALIA